MRPEQDAFLENLYREFFRQLWIYAMTKLNDPDRAEEVVQDAFHEAVKNIDELMEHHNPKGWMMKTVKYKIMHSERSLNRYILRFISLEGLPHESAAVASKPIALDDTDQIIKEVQSVLTNDEWFLIRRIALEKAPYKEVAGELGVTVWTCQKRVQRIREKLKENFPDYL